MSSRIAARCITCVTLLLASPAAQARAADASPPSPRALRIVFVANGGGDYRCASQAVAQAVQDQGLDLHVEPVLYSHGHGRIFADQLDHQNTDEHGRALARKILIIKETCPGRQVYLLGHCAGCPVVLRAAECLPPDSVERIILLAPSTAAGYDLRAALRSSRHGIDVFYSHKDWFCLGVVASFLHILHGQCHPASGRFGFSAPSVLEADGAIYEKLRQYPWQPDLQCTGHTGGHYGCYQQGFLTNFILPLMTDEGPAQADSHASIRP